MHTAEIVRFQYSVRSFIIENDTYTDVQSADFSRYVQNLISEFWQDHPNDNFASPEDALASFKAWFLSDKNSKGIDSIMAQVTVSITRHYGAVSVTYGLTNEVEITKGSDYFAEREKLQSLVEHEFKVYEAEKLPHIKQVNAPGGAGPLPTEDTKTVPLTMISVSAEKGKRMVKCYGGPYSQFGVAFYPEAAAACGFDLDAVPLEGIEPKDATMTVQLVGGKVKRVLSVDIPHV